MRAITRKRRRHSRHGARRGSILRIGFLVGFVLLAAAGGLLLYVWPFSPSLPSRGSQATVAAAPAAAVGVRVRASDPSSASADAHLYSVIPGGIHSEKQLAAVLARDPVVAKHYANFDLAKMRFVRLRHGRKAYVSYRLGNLIFWTSHKIALFAGETLVTDGTHLARARCGNRISEVPQQPTSSFQPSDWALAVPILHLTPASFKFPPLASSSVDLLPTGTPADGWGGVPIFPVVFIPPGGGGDGPVYPPPGDAPLPTPEPATWLLFSSGLVMISMKYLWDLHRS